MRLIVITTYFSFLLGPILGQEIKPFLLETSIIDTLNFTGISVVKQNFSDTIVFSLQATGRRNEKSRYQKFDRVKLHCEEGLLAGWSVYILDDIAYVESKQDCSIAILPVDSLTRDFPLLRVFDLPFFNFDQLLLLERDLKSTINANTSANITRFTVSSNDYVSNEGLEIVLTYDNRILRTYLNTIKSSIGNQSHQLDLIHINAPVAIGIPKNISEFKLYDLTGN